MYTDTIEIVIPIYRTYYLVYKQIYHYSLQTNKNWILSFCDNTPPSECMTIPFDNVELMALRCDLTIDKYIQIKDKIKWHQYSEIDGIDGERHGSVLDYMIKTQCVADYICIQDSDFFWVDDTIISKALNYFNIGYDAIGAELFYDDFPYVNDIYPGRAGWKAPCVFGMFAKLQYLKQHTFICSAYEGSVCKKETGWRVRQSMIDDGLKMIIFPACKSKLQHDKACHKSWIYLNLEYPTLCVGFHLIQGSGVMSHLVEHSYADMMNIIKIVDDNNLFIKIENRIINGI